MERLNPCVTGDTKVLTEDGFRTFSELAAEGDDVNVYCLNDKGEIVMSRMLHPRVTGYNVEIVRITLNNGTVLKTSYNHEFLTKNGYVPAVELEEGDEFPAVRDIVKGSDTYVYGEYTGTKKGTVIKKCEVTGEEFETTWDEHELCSKTSSEHELYEKIDRMKEDIAANFIGGPEYGDYVTVKTVEFLDKRENVYNGTVAVYHNYFTSDENTGIIVNQLNCGE